LLDSALHTIFQQVTDISLFELTPHTTYDEYAYAVRSNRASVDGILPPEYPAVRLWFVYYPVNFTLKTDAHCPGAGQWHDHSVKIYGSAQEVISDMVNMKAQFWCQH
jgi:hypothetical protein